jgi:Ca-activated chloride channel family protein
MRYLYTRAHGDPMDEVDLDALLSQLADFLLASGFSSDPWAPLDELPDDSLEALRQAILEALVSGGVLPDDTLARLLGDPADLEGGGEPSPLEQLVDRLVDRLLRDGYLAARPVPAVPAPGQREAGRDHARPGKVRVEITDKSLDFLGYRALRDLLGATGRASVGRHDTRDLATGVEASGPPKPYEFGDTLNLDASETILNAVRRAGLGAAPGRQGEPAIDVQYEDLMVAQSEYQSSCATVLLLDCSHSMVLYGEDRFTPAKRVALALATLIRAQYPGDTLRLVLFHDSAEEVPLARLARVKVGPHYTNTREGLRLARRLLDRERKDMRQIILITDGKPSALTEPGGRIYRNAFGLDPFIVAATFAEVARCRKAGILVNTFMLARDPDLVSFVRRLAAIARGKAYFTTPATLGRYVLLDYLTRKTRTVH